MASGFSSPGVTVQELGSPPIAPGGGFPTTIALVGTAQGYIPFTEREILTGITTVTLTQTGVVSASVVLRSNSTNALISSGSYVVTQSADPDAVALSGDEVFTLRRVALPLTAPTTAAGSSGLITASVSVIYAIAYQNAAAGETGLGPSSTPLASVSLKQINLTAIPLSPDASVTARTVYRKIASPDGDGLWHKVATISDNTTTTLTDNVTEIAAELLAQQQVSVVSGDTVVVSYNYANAGYYRPTLYTDYSTLANAFGLPFNESTGVINSDLTFGALVAFSNGAAEVLAVPSLSSSSTDFTAAFLTLAAEESVAYVVPISGVAAVHTAALAHCTAMNAVGFYRSCIIGKDGSTSTILPATLRAAAQAYNDENVTLLSPAAFEIINPISGATTVIGAHYAAPAVAGALSARDPQIPLTRKPFAFLSGVHDFRAPSDKSLDEGAGLFVIEDKGGVIRCFHSLTTASGNVNTREQSVVRVKHEIARALGRVLDSALIGEVIPQDSVSRFVNGLVEGILENFVLLQLINAYSNVTSRITADPTIIEVRFAFTPMYPTNRVIVGFTIDTTTGVVGVPQAA